jgi:precorrin-2 dehydrogenase/sirohydrochlorin ferrochelatase
MPSYPIFLELSGQTCLVVGGGRVAERKIERLLRCGARVVLISPEVTDDLKKKAAERTVEWRRRDATAEDLAPGAEGRPPRLVFLCTDSPETQRELAEFCRRKGLWVNVADAPKECAFTVPGLVERGDLTLAVSTGGQCPALAKDLREKLEAWLAPEYGVCTRLLGEVRRADIDAGLPAAERHRRLEQLLDGRLLEAIQEGGEEAGRQLIREIWEGAPDWLAKDNPA